MSAFLPKRQKNQFLITKYVAEFLKYNHEYYRPYSKLLMSDVECKLHDSNASSNFAYFKKRTDIPRFYLGHLGENDFGKEETGNACYHSQPFAKNWECPEKRLPGWASRYSPRKGRD